VLLSAQSHAPGSQAALAELCRIYWYPIYTFVLRRGSDVDEAQDLTQGCFIHLLDHKALRQVNPVKGKFRSFLVASLENYLLDEADHSRRLKRGGNIECVSLDTNCAEYRYQLGVLFAARSIQDSPVKFFMVTLCTYVVLSNGCSAGGFRLNLDVKANQAEGSFELASRNLLRILNFYDVNNQTIARRERSVIVNVGVTGNVDLCRE
jgi:hypothetical protein